MSRVLSVRLRIPANAIKNDWQMPRFGRNYLTYSRRPGQGYHASDLLGLFFVYLDNYAVVQPRE